MSPEQLHAAINVTIGDIDDEMAGIAPLIELARHRQLDFIETAAAAQIIQSIYTGVEGLMLLVAKKVDMASFNTPHWHQELLELMSKSTSYRSTLFSSETIGHLRTYLGFRHLVRHSYSNRLREDRVRELLLGLPDFWKLVKDDFIRFSPET